VNPIVLILKIGAEWVSINERHKKLPFYFKSKHPDTNAGKREDHYVQMEEE